MEIFPLAACGPALGLVARKFAASCVTATSTWWTCTGLALGMRPHCHGMPHCADNRGVRGHWLMNHVLLNVGLDRLGQANVRVTLRIYLPIVGVDYGMGNVP